jgi:hypothetical protein
MMWIAIGALGVVVYVLALIFVVPNTEEAHAVASTLFAAFGLNYAAYSFIIWRTR